MKRIISIICVIALLSCAVLTAGAALRGDSDRDGDVTILDATRIQRFLADLVSKNDIDSSAADVDADGSVTILDATRVQRFLAGLCDIDGNIIDDSSDRYKAYYQVVKSLTEKSGAGKNGKYGYFVGLCVVKLIDFDGDDAEELYVVYSEDSEYIPDKQEVYGYVNGKAVSLFKGKVHNYGTSVQPFVRYMTVGSVTYLLTGHKSNLMTLSDTWSALENNSMKEIFSYTDECSDRLDPSSTHIYTLNGKTVSKKTLESGVEAFEAQGDCPRIDLMSYYQKDLLSDTQKTIDFLKAYA